MQENAIMSTTFNPNALSPLPSTFLKRPDTFHFGFVVEIQKTLNFI